MSARRAQTPTVRLTMLACTTLCASVLVGCDGSSDGDAGGDPAWGSYGHDIGNSRHNPDEKTLGPDNVADLVREWDSTETGITEFAVTSTPAVVDGVVYFGDWAGMLHAVDAVDGSRVWSTQLPSTTSGIGAQVNASPFVTADAVYIGGTENLLYGVDRGTGDKLWDPHATIGSEPNSIIWSSPNILDDLLVVGIGSYQVFITTEPSFKGNVVGVDLKTGEPRWTTYVTEGTAASGFGCSVWGSAAIDEERRVAYIGVGQAYDPGVSQYADAVIAMDLDDGVIQWGYQFTQDDYWTSMGYPDGPDLDVGASVILYEAGGRDIVAAGDKAGNFYAIDREDGELVWSQELTPGGRTGGVMASPAVADGVIYVYSNDGIAENIGGSGPGAGTAFALDAADGEIRWQVDMEPGAFGGIAVANGLMFFTTLDGRIHALDITDGGELWSDALLGGDAASSAGGVTVVDGMVFAGAGWDWISLESPPGGLTAYALP